MSYTAELRGLHIGVGTVYRWATFPAGFGLPAVRSDDIMLPDRDGELAGIDRLAGRTLVFDVYCLGDSPDDVEAQANFLKAAWRPSAEDLELKFQLARGEYSLFGRPRGCDIVIEKTLLGGVMHARLEFKAMDPRLFSAIENSIGMTLPAGGGGLMFNASANFNFGGAVTGGVAVATNDDVVDTDFVIEFTGPLTNPSMTHVEDNAVLSFNGDLAPGEILVLDSRTRSVLLNGSSRYAWLEGGSKWFLIHPGGNTLQFRADGGSGTATVTWRNASV